MTPDALILARNAPKCVWRPGSTRTRWGSLSAPPDPLAAKRGPTSKGRGKEGRGGEGTRGKGGVGGGGEGKGREGSEGRTHPKKKTWLRACHQASLMVCVVHLLRDLPLERRV